MKKQWIGILVCVALLGGLLGFMIWNNEQTRQAAEDEAYNQAALNMAQEALREVQALQSAPPTDSTEQGDVASIVITHEGETLNLVYNDNVWTLNGEEISLDSTAVVNALRLLTDDSLEELVIAADANLADYGLEPPMTSFAATTKDGSVYTICLGAATPDNLYIYTTTDGQTIRLLSLAARGALYLDQLIDKTLPTISGETLLSITLQVRGQELIAAERKALPAATDDSVANTLAALRMTQPVPNRDVYMIALSPAVLEPLTNVALGKLIDRATPENMAAYGFLDPAVDVTLIGEGYRYHLTIGDTAADGTVAYAVYEGIPYIFEISASAIRPLLAATPLTLMDRFVSLVPLDTVASINIDNYGRRLTYYAALNRTDSGIAPTLNGQRIEEAAFRQFYESVTGIMFDRMEENYEPTGDPIFVITYTTTDGTPSIADTYYDYNAQFCALSKDGRVFLVSHEYISALSQAADDVLAGRLSQ